MGARRYKTHYEDFELDLTPLLAIIMKLVPVLIITSSFLQLSQIETDLPQVVQDAIKNQDANPEKESKITLFVKNDKSINIQFGDNQFLIPKMDNQMNLEALNKKLVEIKKQNTKIFKIELAPDSEVQYSDVVQVMDETRKARDNQIFTFKDVKTGKDMTTDYMYPEVVFANIFDSKE